MNILLSDGKVKLAKERMAIDLGGIGKGFAIQKTFDKLHTSWGFIAIAGDMKIWGHERLLGVYDPIENGIVFLGINNKDLCLSSSGNYHKKHIFGSQDDIVGITVVHQDCTYADAFSTALFAMDRNKRQEFINKHSLPVMILYNDRTYFVNDRFVEFFKDYQFSSSWKPRKQE